MSNLVEKLMDALVNNVVSSERYMGDFEKFLKEENISIGDFEEIQEWFRFFDVDV